MMRAIPSGEAVAVSQLMLGEGFDILDRAGDWVWGSSAHDDYVGYLPHDAVGASAPPTHRISAPLALLFAAPDIKAPVLARWPIGARFAGAVEGDFVATGHGFVHRRHAAPIAGQTRDPVAVAEQLIGLPYLWGGRGAGGIDCSGLVQLALSFAGTACPRDSDQQQEIGAPIEGGAPALRGDLVFFPGHVGMMVDAARLIHANAYWMAVTIEPLADVVARLTALHAQPIVARRRITP